MVREQAGTSNINLLNGGLDEVFTRSEGAGTWSPLRDGLGSTLALADGAGSVPSEYAYGAFGDTASTGASSSNASQYTGRENDGTGLQFNRARYYSPTLQRFISEDPITLASGDTNFYAYVDNNPLNKIDPLGLDDADYPVEGRPYNYPSEAPPSMSGRKSISCSSNGCTQSWSDCYAKCIENHRLDSLIPLLGSALPKRLLPPFRVVYPTQTLTTPLSVTAHYLPRTMAGVAGAMRGAGRIISGVVTPMLVFEGFYDLGLLGSCAELCYRNPCN